MGIRRKTVLHLFYLGEWGWAGSTKEGPVDRGCRGGELVPPRHQSGGSH